MERKGGERQRERVREKREEEGGRKERTGASCPSLPPTGSVRGSMMKPWLFSVPDSFGEPVGAWIDRSSGRVNE
jgi:hypothetical protein